MNPQVMIRSARWTNPVPTSPRNANYKQSVLYWIRRTQALKFRTQRLAMNSLLRKSRAFLPRQTSCTNRLAKAALVFILLDFTAGPVRGQAFEQVLKSFGYADGI